MIGPGKYDDQCTRVRHETRAAGVLLIVVEGVHGSGFSAHLPAGVILSVPAILRDVAAEIERSGPFKA